MPGRSRRRHWYAALSAAGLLAASLAGPASAASPDIVISEVYGGGGNSGAHYTHDYVELFNRGDHPVSLDGWSVQYASATGTGHFAANAPVGLTGTVPPGGYYLIQLAAGSGGAAPLPPPDRTGSIPMSAASGKVVVARTAEGLSCNGGSAPCDAAQRSEIADLIGYGDADFFEGSGAAPRLSNITAARRADDGARDTDDNAADVTAGTPGPRGSGTQPPPPPSGGCESPATHQVAEVQGSGSSSPLVGQTVRVEGVVTGDFQNGDQLRGFFLQDATPDADPATSEGLFAFGGDTDLAVGDRVLVTGRVVEFHGLTELSPVTAVDVCGAGAVAATPVDLPRAPGTTFEPLENMLATFPEPLTVSEHYNLGRFGEVTVSSDGRLFQPTERAEPGAAAAAVAELGTRRRLLVDDGSTVQNPDAVPHLTPAPVRLGDTTRGLTGVLSFGFGSYRLQPTRPVAFDRHDPRPAKPAPVGGDVRVASFNTLNYFTTLGSEHPEARGADSAEEFERQRAKEVAALLALDADVVGLMEIENNGGEAVGDLVAALNAATEPGRYAHVTEPALNPPNALGGEFGTDAIKVSLIYRPGAVRPLGPARTSSEPVFDRPPLIQLFQQTSGSEPFTVAVNHFKSKGCGGASGSDADQGDGQGCWNARRTAQAQALVSVIQALDLPNPLILGDLNAYSREDPVDAIEAAGFTGLTERFLADDDRYSYVFNGHSGELDHVLAGRTLLDNVTGAAIWHVNADEPRILDYNTEFNPPSLYRPDAYRSSDHDPLVIGLTLRPDVVPGRRLGS